MLRLVVRGHAWKESVRGRWSIERSPGSLSGSGDSQPFCSRVYIRHPDAGSVSLTLFHHAIYTTDNNKRDAKEEEEKDSSREANHQTNVY